MTKKIGIYKCEFCGNIVEVLHEGKGQLICCGQPMVLLEEKTTDKGKEKHVPLLEKTDDFVNVKVGSVPHPMEDEHFIEFIDLVTKDGVYRKFLKPGDKPVAEFETNDIIIKVREHCTIHGLWSS